MKILLVNPNLMVPPIAPVSLDLLGDALHAHGYEPIILDLAFALNIENEIKKLDGKEYLFAAITLRNLDDSMFPGTDDCLTSHKKIVVMFRDQEFTIVGGGVGFSTAPESAAKFLGLDYAIAGDGEHAIVELADVLKEKSDPRKTPGLVGFNDFSRVELSEMSPSTRSYVDNRKYFNLGGQIGFETKRGCPHRCMACPEPTIKGRKVRMRDPVAVAAEIRFLISQGVDVMHTCDCEFNVPHHHALAVCREFIKTGVGENIRWYAYCSPAGFNTELADLMRRAGCTGVDFSADHGDSEMLERLSCPHTVDDIKNAADSCKKAGLRFMFDLLLGSPGESRKSIEKGINLMRELAPTRIGASLGVRLYPGCLIMDGIDISQDNSSIHTAGGGEFPLWPVYYQEKGLGDDVREWLGELIGNDRRFFYAETTHNYNNNDHLCALIRNGERGAYWDILARAAGD